MKNFLDFFQYFSDVALFFQKTKGAAGDSYICGEFCHTWRAFVASSNCSATFTAVKHIY